MHKLFAMVQIESEDPRLDPEHIARTVANATDVSAARATVLAALPHKVTRIVAVMPELHARAVMELYEEVLRAAIAQEFVRPGTGGR